MKLLLLAITVYAIPSYLKTQTKELYVFPQEDGKPYSQVYEFCQGLNMELANINSFEERDLVMTVLESESYISGYIGMNFQAAGSVGLLTMEVPKDFESRGFICERVLEAISKKKQKKAKKKELKELNEIKDMKEEKVKRSTSARDRKKISRKETNDTKKRKLKRSKSSENVRSKVLFRENPSNGQNDL